MSLVTRALVAVAAGGLAALAAPAHATPVGPICRQVTQNGTNVAAVCVTVDPGESGTTVAPAVRVQCGIPAMSGAFCAKLGATWIGIGTTGFVPNLSYTPPAVDPATGSVHVFAGTIGTLWVDGTSYPIGVDDYCVGDPSFC